MAEAQKEFEPRQHYNYIKLFIQQSGGLGGIFTTKPRKIKANFINRTNPENCAFGYFRLTEVDKKVDPFE